MNESILIFVVLTLTFFVVLLAQWYDKVLLEKIDHLEKEQEQKGILKRHFTSGKKRTKRRYTRRTLVKD
ncbi:MAG: hypothetical protein CMF42_05190 [Legionellales bacterium]|nr:hypothetical protein [Legionellales bacterium]OUX67075.1 MAG: hypothetical protein CBD38_03535 [bacterium TMED178]|tara:strand:- start:6762 stop:6968 length:207 start_codon:yes stop_codon:yes gene_type:complete